MHWVLCLEASLSLSLSLSLSGGNFRGGFRRIVISFPGVLFQGHDLTDCSVPVQGVIHCSWSRGSSSGFAASLGLGLKYN